MTGDLVSADLRSLDHVTVTLTNRESEDFRRQCQLRSDGLLDMPLDREDLLTEAELTGCALPERLLRTLSRFRAVGNPAGGLVVRNLPLDQALPSTPDRGQLPAWKLVSIATFAQLAVASRLGDVIAYADEKDGCLIQDVVPVAAAANRQENTGTVYLELHTEDGFHPYLPDHVLLLCLRPDPEREARTILGSVSEVLPRLSAESLQCLRRPLYRIRVSTSFSRSAGRTYSRPLPVLSGPADAPRLVTDFHAMEALSSEAAAALAELEAAMLPQLSGAVLEAGDLVIIDNRTAAHGRTRFTARYDGTDRWLRRCFTVADLHATREVRPAGSRVCAPLAEIGFSRHGR